MSQKQKESHNKRFEVTVRENVYLPPYCNFLKLHWVFGRYTVVRDILDKKEDSESENIHYLFNNKKDAHVLNLILHYHFALAPAEHAWDTLYLREHNLECLSKTMIKHDYGNFSNLGNSNLFRLKLNKERHDFIESQIKSFKNTSECLIETFKNPDNRDNFHIPIDSNTITIKEESFQIFPRLSTDFPKLSTELTPNSDALRYSENPAHYCCWLLSVVDFLYIQNQREMAIDESTQLKKMDNQHFYLFSSELDYLNFFFFLRDTAKQQKISNAFFDRFSNQKTFGHEVAILESLAHYKTNILSENNPATTLIAFEANHELHRLIRHILNAYFSIKPIPDRFSSRAIINSRDEVFPHEPELRFFSRRPVEEKSHQDDEKPVDSPLNNPDKHL